MSTYVRAFTDDRIVGAISKRHVEDRASLSEVDFVTVEHGVSELRDMTSLRLTMRKNKPHVYFYIFFYK